MSKLTIHCNSVEEYFNLPFPEREYKGLYKVPISLPSELFSNTRNPVKGWDSFYKQIQKEYPIQYFFRHWLTSYDNPVYKFFRETFYWPFVVYKSKLRLFFSPCHPRWRKVLPRTKYSDITELVVEANFALILDFYYEEVENGWVDWSSTKEHKAFYDQLVSNVNWIVSERRELDEAISKELTKANKKQVYKKDGHLDYYATYKKLHRLEDEKKNKETKILIWFIENKDRFWT